MSQKNETVVLVLALLITGGILGGGFWWFTKKTSSNSGNIEQTSNNNQSSSAIVNNPNINNNQATFSPPGNVAQGTKVIIDGSTSMVLINQMLKNRFQQQFPGTIVNTNARGSTEGINALIAGNIDIAAISRNLTPQEQSQGLVAIPVTEDAIALFIGKNNSFQRSLTSSQVKDIFTGNITDWSAVGGSPGTIKVINRPSVSGTHQAFRELVLQGANFGSGSNFTMLTEDATTPIIRELGNNGISYATFSQIVDQQTAKIIPIDGLTPEAPTYPYKRTLYYVYKQPANPGVAAFLGYMQSPAGQDAIINVK